MSPWRHHHQVGCERYHPESRIQPRVRARAKRGGRARTSPMTRASSPLNLGFVVHKGRRSDLNKLEPRLILQVHCEIYRCIRTENCQPLTIKEEDCKTHIDGNTTTEHFKRLLAALGLLLACSPIYISDNTPQLLNRLDALLDLALTPHDGELACRSRADHLLLDRVVDRARQLLHDCKHR